MATTPSSRNKARTVVIVTGLLVAGLALLGSTAYQRDIRQARERISTGSELAQTPCGPIEYAVAGEGPPVLVIHGTGGGYDQGLDFVQPLVGSGFRIIAMSRFGYLRTPLPSEASPAAQADAHACLLDALDIERVAVIGGSAGAPSAMQLALRHPERVTALVLLVPAAYVPRPDDAPPPSALAQFLFDTALQSDFLFWAANKLARGTLIQVLLATPPYVVKTAAADEQLRVQQILDHLLPVSQRRLGLLNDAAIASSLPRYELERITVPTLAVSVADDLFGTYDSARYTVEHISGARFIGYPSGGHVWVGHHQEIMAEFAEFLK